MGSAELELALHRLATAAGIRKTSFAPASEKLNLSPGCTFGAVIEQRLKDLDRDLAEVKGRLNGLIFLVASAVVVDIVMRLVK